MNGPQITCIGCQGERGRGKFRADIGTWVCDVCYIEISAALTARTERLPSGGPNEKKAKS